MRRSGNRCDARWVAIRCLIVDDNDSLLEVARDLEEREGLSVVAVASTSADALHLVKTLRADGVVVDIFLGDESGATLPVGCSRTTAVTGVFVMVAVTIACSGVAPTCTR